MNVKELMGHIRCDVLRDTAEPYLWSDTELLHWLNEAHNLFARRTHALTDDTDAMTTFQTEAGTASYKLDDRIVFVAEAGIVTDDGNGNLSYQELRDRTRVQLRNTLRQGRPCAFTAQVSRNNIRLYPVPDDVYDIQMVVARKPLKRLVHAQDVPEIDEDYQYGLCDYVAWKALTNNDPEGANMSAAKDFQAAWALMLRDAKRDFARLRAGPNPRARGNWTGKIRRYA